MNAIRKRIAASVVVLALVSPAAWLAIGRGERADARFRPSARESAFAAGGGPRVLVDAAHHEAHTIDGLFGPLAALLRSDGFVVAANEQPLTANVLGGAAVLVVGGAGASAFSDAELAAVDAWVRRGGSLLLAADDRDGEAAAELAARFGVELSTGVAADGTHADSSHGESTWIAFSRDDGGVRSHPVTDGRGGAERVRRAVSFGGRPLVGPAGSTALLALSNAAEERRPDGGRVSAAGRAAAVALWHGSGRVVVFGDAAMLTAVTTGAGRLRYGMPWPGADDERLAINAARWLGGYLR